MESKMLMWKMAVRSDRKNSWAVPLTALLLLAASCQRAVLPVEEPDPVPQGKKVVVSASFGEETRTSIRHDDAQSQYLFQWDAGDRIGLIEAALSPTGADIAAYVSESVGEACDVARFPVTLSPKEAESGLQYLAYYPGTPLEGNLQSLMDQEYGGLILPLAFPDVQYPKADSFDPAADLLVSKLVTEEEQPEELHLYFARLGCILKLQVAGLTPGTRIQGGVLTLGYRCQGALTYDTAQEASHYFEGEGEGEDGIHFLYTYDDPETNGLVGTPLVADAQGNATVWLRLKPGTADGDVNLLIDAEDTDGETVQYSRYLNMKARGKSVVFKEGGLTTLSIDVNAPSDGVIPRTLQHMPAVYVDTKGAAPITSKTEWMKKTRVRIYGDDDRLLFEDLSANIRGRGNSTWRAPKKPYYLKLDKKNDLFGTGKSKKYVLLANYYDRTLLRNDVTFEAARRTSLEWTPMGIFVKLYLNDAYQGIYWLGEKVEVEDYRLQADYLFNLDRSAETSYGDDSDPIDFYTEYGYRAYLGVMGLPVEIKHPDRDDYPEGFEPVIEASRALFAQLEEAIRNDDYEDYLDLDTFCDWFLIQELVGNPEPKHPKSCYFYARDGKFYAGPVWDFDYETFTLGKTGLVNGESMYYPDLLNDTKFLLYIRARWNLLRPRFLTLGTYIDQQADWIRTSESENHQMWPINDRDVNHDERRSFQSAVDRMKLSIIQRIAELDEAFDISILRNGGSSSIGGQDVQFLNLEDDLGEE